MAGRRVLHHACLVSVDTPPCVCAGQALCALGRYEEAVDDLRQVRIGAVFLLLLRLAATCALSSAASCLTPAWLALAVLCRPGPGQPAAALCHLLCFRL